MNARRWLVVVVCLVLLAGAVTLVWLPQIVRHVAIARIHALTQRPVTIDAVDVNLLRGWLTVRGLKITERDGSTPFADIHRLDIRVHPSILIGRLRLRDLVVDGSTVHVVRLAGNEFNFSDLIRASGEKSRPLDITIDRFALARGTVILEDQALPERRTWTSEQITIEAHNLSSRRDDGTGTGRSVTAGAPVSVEVRNLRLYPIQLEATVNVAGLDLTPAQVYLPPNVPIRLDRGRMSTSLVLHYDARGGIQADGTADLEDVALMRSDAGDPLALVPKLTVNLAGLGVHEGGMALRQLGVEGSMSVRNPRGKPGARLALSSVRANVADLTWPATTSGRIDVQTSVPGGGTLVLTGTVEAPPAPTQLRLRLADLDLATWAQFVPTAARITGLGEADLRINEPVGAGIPAHVEGTIAVNRLGVADARQQVLAARRIEASGLELEWPTRVVVKRVLISDPRGILERDSSGHFPLRDLATRPAEPSSSSTPQAVSTRPPGGKARPAAPALAVEVGEIAVRNGALAWRDATLSPAARLDVAAIDVGLTGAGWPLRGPLGVRGTLRPPGGGRLELTGRVDLDRLAADVHVVTRKAELAPYQPYVPTRARLAGAADLDLNVVVPSLQERRATVKGTVGLAGVDVRDPERTVMRLDRATATGVDVDWPERVSIDRLGVSGWWLLLERDDKGGLPLRTLLAARRAPTATPPASAASEPSASAATSTTDGAEDGTPPTTVTVAQLSFDHGGLRVVDRSVSPAFAVDVARARLRMNGLSTEPGKTARLDLAADVSPASALTVRGHIAPFGSPVLLNLDAELRDFAVESANPYLLSHVGWKSRDGRVTTKVRCRLEANALSAKTDVRLSRLHLIRASGEDEAQRRIGLPLGMITSLMKDRRGDITVSFPVGGTLSDPRFDFREAMWAALRRVAVHAITLPVSMIGRVHVGSDARIEEVEVDPVPFEAGTATPTAEGQQQVTRLAAFLQQLPEVRMAMTPVVSARDLAEMKRRGVEAALERRVGQKHLSREEAALRLFEERFPNRPAPATAEAIVATLIEQEPTPSSAIPELATQRLDTIRAGIRRAGIDTARLVDMKVAERDDFRAEVDLEVRQPETPQPSKMREVLKRLGVPLKGSDGER